MRLTGQILGQIAEHAVGVAAGLADTVGRRLLQAADAEHAHALAIAGLRLLPLRGPPPDDRRLAVNAFGLAFPNPVGTAAGFDKNAQVADAVLQMGAGFAEIGTVTPRPQDGNPRPRLFRLAADRAVVNRMGFNNAGHAAALARLRRRLAEGSPGGIVGVNLGANKDTGDRAADYVAGITGFADVASYFAVNVSSPNTPGLRDLQQAAALDDLLARVLAARDALAETQRRPVLLKIAPDVTLGDLDDIVQVARARGVDGMIVCNTTIGRPAALRDKTNAAEAGGLSGRPLFALSTRMLAETFVRAEGTFPLVGVGGIDSPATALAKLEAGAALIQLYTGLVYGGIGLIGAIKRGILEALERERLGSVGALTGRSAARLTAEAWPVV